MKAKIAPIDWLARPSDRKRTIKAQRMRILHGVVLALAFSADGACAWIVSPACRAGGVANGRRRAGSSLSMQVVPGEGGESQRTRREAIALGGAAAASTLAVPADAAEKKKKKKKMQPVVVTDKDMAEITAGKWLEKHRPGTRDLVVGLEGEPYFLLSGKEGLEPYALRCVLHGMHSPLNHHPTNRSHLTVDHAPLNHSSSIILQAIMV